MVNIACKLVSLKIPKLFHSMFHSVPPNCRLLQMILRSRRKEILIDARIEVNLVLEVNGHMVKLTVRSLLSVTLLFTLAFVKMLDTKTI